MTPGSNSAGRIAELRREARAADGIASRAREAVLILRDKRMRLGSSAADRAKEKRASASIDRLSHKAWLAEQRASNARREIRAMGGIVR